MLYTRQQSNRAMTDAIEVASAAGFRIGHRLFDLIFFSDLK